MIIKIVRTLVEDNANNLIDDEYVIEKLTKDLINSPYNDGIILDVIKVVNAGKILIDKSFQRTKVCMDVELEIEWIPLINRIFKLKKIIKFDRTMYNPIINGEPNENITILTKSPLDQCMIHSKNKGSMNYIGVPIVEGSYNVGDESYIDGKIKPRDPKLDDIDGFEKVLKRL